MTTRHEAARESGLAVALGTLSGLHYKLKERLAAAMADLSFDTRNPTVQRAPTVLDSMLPPKVDSDAENYPFVIVRHRSGGDTVQSAEQNGTAVVEIVVGTFSDSDDGYVDLLTLIDIIRADLGAEPVIEGTAYEHIGPLTWEIPAAHLRPLWLANINSNWQLPRPVRRDAVEG